MHGNPERQTQTLLWQWKAAHLVYWVEILESCNCTDVAVSNSFSCARESEQINHKNGQTKGIFELESLSVLFSVRHFLC
jgi:hypothetical protein